MSTEQQPPASTPPGATPPATATAAPTTELPRTEPKAEPNALAVALADWWDRFKRGQFVSYRVMAIVLILVAAIGAWVYVSYGNRKNASAAWAEWDGLGSAAAMKEYAEKNPGTVQGRLAALDAARAQLGPQGIDQFAAPVPQARKTAVENVEKAREALLKLADEFKNDRPLRVQCLLGVAKAEAALVGMPKEGQTIDPLNPKPVETRGDPKKAVEYLDKVAEAAPDTDWGKDAKKLADELRNMNTQEQVFKLQASVYSIAAPSIPGMDPLDPTKKPRDPFHGFGP